MNLFVFIQHEDVTINTVSIEALKGAQEIAEKSNGSVTGITFSTNVGKKLTKYDLNEILAIDDKSIKIKKLTK